MNEPKQENLFPELSEQFERDYANKQEKQRHCAKILQDLISSYLEQHIESNEVLRPLRDTLGFDVQVRQKDNGENPFSFELFTIHGESLDEQTYEYDSNEILDDIRKKIRLLLVTLSTLVVELGADITKIEISGIMVNLLG